MGLIQRLFLFIAIFLTLIPLSFAETVYVSVQSTTLRKSPQQFAARIADLSYGSPVDKISEDNDWLTVKLKSGQTGYLHVSAVNTSQPKLRTAGNAKRTFSDDTDVALAGKGFDKEVEGKFASQHANADFGGVDRMERLQLSDSELQQFVEQGRLQ